MKRRALLHSGIAAMALGCLPGSAQVLPKRAAIIIGVDKCKADGFATLDGASSGAFEVQKWLEKEKYDEVIPFLDDHGKKPVKFEDISDAIDSLVDKAIYAQLVIYFAGHGFYKGDEEVWMLSECPAKAREAIGLNSTVRLAKRSGIHNITIISDACRSPANTVALQEVSPDPLFPNKEAAVAPGKIDRFFATQTGAAASEASIQENVKSQGLFTEAFLAAFTNPVTDMVRTLDDGTQVVPNRRLEKFLISEVQKLAQKIDFNLKQVPECDVPSDDDFFIARVKSGSPIVNRMIKQTIPSWNDINSSEFHKLGFDLPSSLGRLTQNALDQAALSTGFTETVQEVKSSIRRSNVWRQVGAEKTGFVIVGKRVERLAVNPRSRATLRDIDGQAVIVVDLGNDQSACSVAVTFDDRTGMILAALRNFVGTVATSTDAVASVSYDPEYAVGDADDHVARLRATAAAAYKTGVLRFQGVQAERQKQAEQFGNTVRMGKGIDPSLGLYAAYAYDEANLPKQVSSVRSFMAEELHADMFDVAMLDQGSTPRQRITVPFCPALGVGWSYLNSSSIELPKIVGDARRYLISSPWTAFNDEGMKILMAGLEDGTLS
jgi:hypothetical protein